MNLVQLTPGAGGMYCGNCFRDNALVAELRLQGHEVLMVPLYLPMTLEEEDASFGTPIFFNGINVYLDQKSAWFRRAPAWVHRMAGAGLLLRAASRFAARTRAAEVGDMTISMLQGEVGYQARELEELVGFLADQSHPDAVCLSNAMLLGLTRRLKSALKSRVVCTLQGEDAFIDEMPDPLRGRVWELMAERAREVDLFLAPSRYFADRMAERLQVDPAKMSVMHNGIRLEGYEAAPRPADPPAIGYFARMCPEKGLGDLVEAFLLLKKMPKMEAVRLRVGGGCGPGDQAFVKGLQRKLANSGCAQAVTWHPNLSREAKQQFLRDLTLFSVPAGYGEAFGLYLVEALASGVPVVQPRTAAFPEIVEATGGGVLCEPGQPEALARAWADLLQNPRRARELGDAGRQSVERDYGIDGMARRFIKQVKACVDAAEQS